MTTEKLDISAVVGSQARACARRYVGFVEQEDLEQEAWVWICENPKKIKDHEKNDDVSLAAYRLGQDIWGVMDRYARREKSHNSGYEPEDDLYFSDTLIGLVLPSVLKDDPTPPTQSGERVANTSDPAEGGNWLATYLDVKRAWQKAMLTDDQRDLLGLYYYHEYTQQEIADQLVVTQQTVAKRLKNARRKLIDQLGGPNPREYNTEHTPRPGTKYNEPGIASQVD